MHKIDIPPQTYASRLADYVMTPIMYVLQGTFREVPQRTHRWNNIKLPLQDLNHLDASQMVTVQGDTTALPRWFGFIPIFHIPILGGWKKYSVITPTTHEGRWHVGWVVFDVVGVSQIPLSGPVRVLQAPYSTQFFGLAKDGTQIPVSICGEGVIGSRSPFVNLPLL